MKTNTAGIITLALLALAAGVTTYSMVQAASGFDLGTLLFICWAVSPYVCFYAAVYLIHKFMQVENVWLISAAISVLMCAFTIFAYGG
ncbi:MAG: hypothetical protein ABR530_07380, partial [Pyrinomonadaceae bacterium]